MSKKKSLMHKKNSKLKKKFSAQKKNSQLKRNSQHKFKEKNFKRKILERKFSTETKVLNSKENFSRREKNS